MADRIQQRRDTAARWAQYNPVLLEGEVGYVTDNPNQYKIGDGVHAWNDLPLRGYTGTIVQETGNDENTVMSQKAVTEKFSELEETLNVSNKFPTGGIDGTNKYDLVTAVSKIADEKIKNGFRILFINNVTNILSSYTFCGGEVENLDRWIPSYLQGENSITISSSYDFYKLDDVKDAGFYYISAGNLNYYATLNVYSEYTESIIIQELVGANVIDRNGQLSSNQNNVITRVVRVFNISSPNFLDRANYGEWSKWSYYQNEFIDSELGESDDITISQKKTSTLFFEMMNNNSYGEITLDKSVCIPKSFQGVDGYFHTSLIPINSNNRVSCLIRIKGSTPIIWYNSLKEEIGSIEIGTTETREYIDLVPPENAAYVAVQSMDSTHNEYEEYNFYITIKNIVLERNELMLNSEGDNVYSIPFSSLLTGSISDDTDETYRKTPFIRVFRGDTVSVSIRVKGHICGYFYSKDKLHSVAITTGIVGPEVVNFISELTVPGWAEYIVLQTMSSTHASYEKYDYYIKINRKSDRLIENLYSDVNSLKNTYENIENKNWDYGIFNISVETEYYNRSPYIPIDKETEMLDVSLRIKGGRYLEFYGENAVDVVKSYEDLGADAVNIKQRFSVPDGAKYFRVVTMNDTHPDYEDYGFYVHKVFYKLENNSSVHQGMPVSFDAIPSLQLWAAQEINFSDGSEPISKNFLFCEVDNTYNFYIARDKFGNGMSFLFSWRQDLQEATPTNYSAAVLPNGDILFIYKSEAVYGEESTDSWQKNPILYERANGYEPVEIDFGDSVKPGGWLQNVGFNAIYPYGCLIFGEYTRKTAQKARIWKVSYPYNEKNSWKVVKEFDIDYTTEIPNSIKHIHTIQFDQYTGLIYACTGDENQGSNIWVSKDQGENWEFVYGPSEKYCRLLNFIFTDSYVYWATDSPTDSLHFLFKAERGEDGVIKVSEAEELTQLLQPESGMLLATYGLSYLKTINALLLLERVDGLGWQWMPIRLWDLNSNSLKTIGRIESVSGEKQNMGFRCQFLELYPKDNSIMCGYNQFSPYRNYNKLLGNRNSSDVNERINNIIIRVDRAGDDFGISFNSVYK